MAYERSPRHRDLTRRALATVVILGGTTMAGCTAPVEASSPPHVTATQDAKTGALGLPLIPWEGGPSYWKQFAKADAAGWDEPSFFPIVAWYDSVSTADEVEFDRGLGINTYIGMPSTMDPALLDDAGSFWIGSKLNEKFTAQTPSWVGYFLDDEADGRYTPKEGQEVLKQAKAAAPEGLFTYANFTSMVLETDLPSAASSAYVNEFTDVVSVDKYWYTIPQCSQQPYRDANIIPLPQTSCRSASSYGHVMDELRQRDAEDGRLQPLWQFVENLGGSGGGTAEANYITPQQLQGAVMNSIIHEARGIVYFNQSLSGSCQSGNVFRQAQVVPNFCGKAQVEAVRQIDARIHQLAPVINTQSLAFDFGDGLDTMLKVKGSSAYIFAMTKTGSSPGQRTFTLPAGVKGSTVEVLFEDRSLPVSAQGSFTDSFARENSYHVYRVRITP